MDFLKMLYLAIGDSLFRMGRNFAVYLDATTYYPWCETITIIALGSVWCYMFIGWTLVKD